MKKYKLEELGDIVTGKTPKTSNKNNFGKKHLFITPSDLQNGFPIKHTERYLSDEGLKNMSTKIITGKSVLVDCIGSNLGNVGFTSEKCLTNQQINSITNFKDFVNPYYIYFWFKDKQKYLQKIAGGSSIPIVNKTLFSNIEINLPSLDKQNELVNKILIFEKKVKINRKIIKDIENYLELIYYKLVNNHKSNYNPNRNNKWQVIKLNDLINIKSNSINPKKNPNEKFNYYSIPHFDKTMFYKIEYGKNINSNKYLINNNNLLISKLNPRNPRIIYVDNIQRGICSTEFVVLEPKNKYYKEYLYVIAKSEEFKRFLESNASGTSNSHKRISPDKILDYEIIFNKNEIRKYNKLIKPKVKKINLLIEQNQHLKEMSNLLSYKLIE